MSTAAAYINANQLAVAGNVLDTFRIGTRIKLDQGTDGLLLTDVAAAVYDDTNTRTVITCASGALTANLATIQHGWTFVDPTNSESNLAMHFHTNLWDGGQAAFGLFTDAGQIQSLLTIATVDPTVANELFGVNAAGTAIEKKAIQGTANEVIVANAAGQMTFSLPQPVAATSSPTFGGMLRRSPKLTHPRS